MARRTKLSVAVQDQDRGTVNGLAVAVHAIAGRYPHAVELVMAGRLLDEWVQSPLQRPAAVAPPAKAARKAKVAPAVETEPAT